MAVPLISATGNIEKIVGVVVTVVAVVGGVISLLPSTTALLYRDATPTESE